MKVSLVKQATAADLIAALSGVAPDSGTARLVRQYAAPQALSAAGLRCFLRGGSSGLHGDTPLTYVR